MTSYKIYLQVQVHYCKYGRFIWLLILWLVRLVKVCASWPDTHVNKKIKKKKKNQPAFLNYILKKNTLKKVILEQ
jgi:hypothetical protein